MSFSSEIKEELSKISNLGNKTQVRQELIGYLISVNSNIIAGKQIRYATESEYNINRFSKLLANLEIHHNIEIEGNVFVITLKSKEIGFIEMKENQITIQQEQKVTKAEGREKTKEQEENKALIRGAFLGAGSINNPENTYHLEMIFLHQENAEMIKEKLEEFSIKVKELKRKNKYSLYIKEGEEISKLLALMGANKGVLKFEEIRVKREMRGKVNRLVNCKTANLSKTINASVEQIEAIQKLQNRNKFNLLEDNLKEIAILRLENPDMSLVELGQKLNSPLGKSGVNYRLRKIIEIAKEIS